jgi:hypothetical protein
MQAVRVTLPSRQKNLGHFFGRVYAFNWMARTSADHDMPGMT